MNANDARKVTAESLKGHVIEKFIEHIDARIAKAAKKGNSSVHNPQVGSADEGYQFYLKTEEKKAVRLYYEGEGFKWEDSPDPDPGHPCSGPYTTLSW